MYFTQLIVIFALKTSAHSPPVDTSTGKYLCHEKDRSQSHLNYDSVHNGNLQIELPSTLVNIF